MKSLIKFASFAFVFGLSLLVVDSANAQTWGNNRSERREYRENVRDARRDYRNDIRRGQNPWSARREYRDEIRDARRDYRRDTRRGVNRSYWNRRNYNRSYYNNGYNNGYRRYYSRPSRSGARLYFRY